MTVGVLGELGDGVREQKFLEGCFVIEKSNFKDTRTEKDGQFS